MARGWRRDAGMEALRGGGGVMRGWKRGEGVEA